jgi:hypothetical protein
VREANGETDLSRDMRYIGMATGSSRKSRVAAALCTATLLASVGASAVFAGEITGNGKSLHITDSKWGTNLHARSFCAFSGQEDLQFLDDNGVPLEVTHKGVPGHAQSWGQIPKAGRDFLTSVGSNPGIACNPIRGGTPTQ